MDADSSYGGSDTAQDLHSSHDNSSLTDTNHSPHHKDVTTATHDIPTPQEEPNNFYHKNEITLPVNYDETDFQDSKPLSGLKQPHYLSTANLNINETLENHSNLEEMSKNYKSTSRLNEKQSPKTNKKADSMGVDNPAFCSQDEEHKPEVKSTFDHNRPYNGDLNSSAALGLTSPDKSEQPLTEAVNLELINLKPSGKDVTGAYENGTNGMTGIPVKKETDAEMGNPYDEYFVPVNEHRKYMRGEKLYVTMDKRNKKKRNKCLCWGICLCVVAAAVILGILAAVGVIGNQTPVQEVSARHFGSSTEHTEEELPVKTAGVVFGLPSDINDGEKTQTLPFTPSPPVSTVSSILPSTETSMIEVPRALESQLVLDNVQFTPELAQKNSTEYKRLSKALEADIKNSLFSSDFLNYGAADIDVKVVDFAAGSVVVKYRITWTFKDGIHNAKDPIDPEMLKMKMENVLSQRSGFIDTYHVADNTVTAERVLDLCKIENNGCDFKCAFDYSISDFVCSCPEGKHLTEDQKTCTFTEELNIPDFHFDHTPETKPSEESEPFSEPEPTNRSEPTHDVYHHYHIPETTPEPTVDAEPSPDPTSEPEPTNRSEPTHDVYYHHHIPETTPKPAVQAEPSPEPTAEPSPVNENSHILIESSPEPTSEPEPEPTNKPETVSHNNYVHFHEIPVFSTEHTFGPYAEPTYVPTHAFKSEPTPEPTSGTITENNIGSFVDLNEETTSKLSVEPTPEPGLESKDEYKTKIIGVNYAKPTDEPTPEPTAEPKAESFAETTPKLFDLNAQIIPIVQNESTTEPSNQPVTESKPEPSAQSTPEPKLEFLAEVTTELTTERLTKPIPEAKAEPTSEPKTETITEPIPKVKLEPLEEHISEIIAEHKVQETLTVATETASQPSAEPTAEPPLEHSFGSNTEHKMLINPESNIELTTEPIIERKIQTTTKSEYKMAEFTTDITTEYQNVTESSFKHSSKPAVPLTETLSELTTMRQDEISISATEIATTTQHEGKASMEKFTTTIHPSEFELRHNFLSHEIFAEPEITTEILHSGVDKILTNMSASESSKPKTEEQNSSVATTMNTVLSEEQTTTIPNTETATRSDISETTKHKEFQLVSINGQPIILQTTTSMPFNESILVPVIINGEQLTVQSQNSESLNKTTEPKIYEVTTQSSEMTKIFTELHKVVDEQYDHSTEMVAAHSTNRTHSEMILMGSSENSSAMDDMSPFLPELENDTFVTTLHLGEHIDHTPKDIHEEETVEAPRPPRLDNDQMNMTNPNDSNPQDATLKVVPLNGNDKAFNDLFDKMIATTLTPDLLTTQSTTTKVAPSEEVTVSPSLESENTKATEDSLENITTSENKSEGKKEEKLNQAIIVANINEATTTISSDEADKTILPSEIINNVHSNTFFDQLEKTKKINMTNATQVEVTTKNEKPNEFSDIKDFSTSTEDLIALETTTNGVKVVESKNTVRDITTEPIKVTTIHAEVLDTATESIIFSENSKISLSLNNTHGNETTKEKDENNNTLGESAKLETTTFASPEATTFVLPQDSRGHQYEVKETVSDVTTTERLFVAAKSTTETSRPTIKPITNINEDEQDLSVIPLVEDEDNKESQNLTIKQISKDLNRIESESNYSVNDISKEEQSVFDKFHHHDFKISTEKIIETESAEVSTTTRSDKLEFDKDTVGDELTKSDDLKYYKKNYLDKTKFDKKAKLEKAVTTINDKEEILTTSLPNENESSPFSNIKPVTEGFTIPGFSRCAITGQFQCVNGTSNKDGSYCIPTTDRCDSVNDCSDGSDEIDCIKDGCPNNFQCDSGQCLKRHLVCDGIQNCNDGTDEVGCEQWNCRSDEYACGLSQRCLPLPWKCDGRKQCRDGSDEHGCPSPTSCPEDFTFHCQEQGTCIPKSWRCDGKSDCMNSEDERSCSCTPDEFRCSLGGGCVKAHERCNGKDDCADRSDEWNCLRVAEENNIKYLQLDASNNTWYPICSENWNQTHSDLACQNLGFASASLSETVNKPEGNFTTYFRLKPHQVYGSSLLAQVEKTNTCDSFVSVTCQEFACGSHLTIDNVQSARIIGGNKATETQWPSLTLLYNKNRNVQCTATLLAPLWAVASHSCIFGNTFSPNPLDWILYAGSTNFFGSNDNSTTQVRQVKLIVSHPQAKFSQFEYTNDLVLVEFSQPLSLTRNVSAVCLPAKDIEPRQLCIIAGWGVSQPGEPNKKQYLHYLPVPIIDAQECNSTKHYNGFISDDKICAGYTDSEKSPCYNDEGAPLMCFSDTAATWELQGVLSHHDNCGRSKHPAIYTSINHEIRQWIINTIGQKPSISA